MESPREILPASTRRITEADVNCLVMEPISNSDAADAGTRCSTSARP